MQAISTKYLPATNTRGSRVKASSASGLSVTVPYPHELSGMACHWEAAKALVAKLGWEADEFVGGGTPTGYVFIALEYRAGVPGERFTTNPAQDGPK